jgi:hypothetical protein
MSVDGPAVGSFFFSKKASGTSNQHNGHEQELKNNRQARNPQDSEGLKLADHEGGDKGPQEASEPSYDDHDEAV